MFFELPISPISEKQQNMSHSLSLDCIESSDLLLFDKDKKDSINPQGKHI